MKEENKEMLMNAVSQLRLQAGNIDLWSNSEAVQDIANEIQWLIDRLWQEFLIEAQEEAKAEEALLEGSL